MDLYLIRHGQSVGNVANIIQGSADLDLTREGKRQARLLAARLKDVRFDALYSSPMKRARATSEAVAGVMGVEVKLASWLAEMDTGLLSGLPRGEIERRYPGFLNRPVEEWDGFPGGETNGEFYARVAAGYDELRSCHADHSCAIAIVSHIATINAIIYRALNLPYVPYPLFGLASASLSKITFRPIGGKETPIVSFVNDTAHLQRGRTH